MNFQTNKFFFPLETFSAIKSLLPEANSLSSVAFIPRTSFHDTSDLALKLLSYGIHIKIINIFFKNCEIGVSLFYLYSSSL